MRTLFNKSLLFQRPWRAVAPGLALLGLCACQPQTVRSPPVNAANWDVDGEREEQLAGEMALIPAGAFRMGDLDDAPVARALPVHSVTLPAFMIGKHEVTMGQFWRFVKATGYRTEAEQGVDFDGCFVAGERKMRPRRNWWEAEYPQEENHPVGCVSWNDAQEFISWLRKRTGKMYRLPTEAEWEYAARAGSETRYYFGEEAEQLCRHGNVMDRTLSPVSDGGWLEWDSPAADCDDGAFFPTTTGRYQPNGYGLHDVYGNVDEWLQDCWNSDYQGAPDDGGAWEDGDCERRVARGGSYADTLQHLNSAMRSSFLRTMRSNALGFRLARDATPEDMAAGADAVPKAGQ